MGDRGDASGRKSSGTAADSLLEADLYDADEEHARENLLATLSRSHFGLVEAVKQSANTEDQLLTWRYTFAAPSEGWNQPAFDASVWEVGRSPLGNLPQDRTPWRTEDIWLRLEFDLDDLRSLPLVIRAWNDDVSGGHWNITYGAGKSHTALFRADPPVRHPEGNRLTFDMRFNPNENWPGQNLGRFRLSVASDPAAFDGEQMLQTIELAGGGWSELASAYYLVGNQEALDQLLERRPEDPTGDRN